MSEKLIETVVTKNDLKFALKHLGVKSSQGLGLTPEYFRNLPDVIRSNHP